MGSSRNSSRYSKKKDDEKHDGEDGEDGGEYCRRKGRQRFWKNKDEHKGRWSVCGGDLPSGRGLHFKWARAAQDPEPPQPSSNNSGNSKHQRQQQQCQQQQRQQPHQ
jgi:hypothetical protein